MRFTFQAGIVTIVSWRCGMANGEKTPQDRLTKSRFLKLSEGVWVVSNVSTPDGTPLYVGKVCRQDERDAQWREIRLSKANGRKFHVFKTEAEYTRQLGSWARAISEARER